MESVKYWAGTLSIIIAMEYAKFATSLLFKNNSKRTDICRMIVCYNTTGKVSICTSFYVFFYFVGDALLVYQTF